MPRLAAFVLVVGDTCGMAAYHVVGVILLWPEEALLCHRRPARLAYLDMWDFSGGHVEPGESTLVALRREVAEELGVELKDVGGPVLRRVDRQRSVDLTVWVSRRWRGEVPNMQPHGYDAIGWFAAAQIEELKLADPSHLTALRRLLSA